VNDSNSKYGLFVCLADSSGCDWQRLEEEDLASLDIMGITKVKPGRYETVCGGKGFGECEEGELGDLVVEHTAIDFFADEKSNSFFVYDAKKKSFKRVWMSD
jgi:hypothetical protein